MAENMETKVRYCMECGKPLRPDALFCANCGKPVKAPAAPAPAPKQSESDPFDIDALVADTLSNMKQEEVQTKEPAVKAPEPAPKNTEPAPFDIDALVADTFKNMKQEEPKPAEPAPAVAEPAPVTPEIVIPPADELADIVADSISESEQSVREAAKPKPAPASLKGITGYESSLRPFGSMTGKPEEGFVPAPDNGAFDGLDDIISDSLNETHPVQNAKPEVLNSPVQEAPAPEPAPAQQAAFPELPEITDDMFPEFEQPVQKQPEPAPAVIPDLSADPIPSRIDSVPQPVQPEEPAASKADPLEALVKQTLQNIRSTENKPEDAAPARRVRGRYDSKTGKRIR